MILAARKVCFSIFSSSGGPRVVASRSARAASGCRTRCRSRGVFTSWATPAASRPMEAIFSECWSCSSRRMRTVTSSRIRMVPRRSPEPTWKGATETFTRSARPSAAGQVQLVDVRGLLVARPAPGCRAAPPGRRPGRPRRGCGPSTSRAAGAVERLHGAVPAHDPAVEVEDEDAGVHALEDVLVVLGEPLQLVRLLAQAVVEAAVHERGGGLAGQGLQQVDLLAVQGVEAVLAARRRGWRSVSPFTRQGKKYDEVEGARLREGLASTASACTGSPPARRCTSGRPRAGARRGAARAAHGAEDREGAVVVGQEQRRARSRRGRRPRPPSSRSAMRAEVEVGVQVLRQPQQHPPRVVALAVEQAVDGLLHAALDRREEEGDHQRGEDGDDGARAARGPGRAGPRTGSPTSRHMPTMAAMARRSEGYASIFSGTAIAQRSDGHSRSSVSRQAQSL